MQKDLRMSLICQKFHDKCVRMAHQCILVTLLLSGLLPEYPAHASTISTNHDRGYDYIHDEVPNIPWSIHIIKLERGRRDFEFCTTLGKGKTLGMATVSEQLKNFTSEDQPVAAINGDFYHNTATYPGDPRDLQIHQGELISAPRGHACFWMDSMGNPHMTNIESRFRVIWPDGKTTPFGLNEERQADQAVLYTSAIGASTRTGAGREFVFATESSRSQLKAGEIRQVRIREIREKGNTQLTPETMVLSIAPDLLQTLPKLTPGSTAQIAMETIPDLSGVQVAIGGGPTLVRNGQAMEWTGFQMRHPRVAIGWNDNFIFLVEVDGRQRALSVGMTFPELASYMVKLGCKEAMNMDGGGSATLWVCGNVINSPSEGKERPGANALVVLHKKAK